MTSSFIRNELYDCTDIARKPKPAYYVNEDMKKEIDSNLRTLPIYEKTVQDRILIKYYSLHRNEKLHCNWKAFVQTLETRVTVPFQFPKPRDFHFLNCAVRYVPDFDTSPNKYRKKLKLGPGIDDNGQMPIPQELHLKRMDLAKLSR